MTGLSGLSENVSTLSNETNICFFSLIPGELCVGEAGAPGKPLMLVWLCGWAAAARLWRARVESVSFVLSLEGRRSGRASVGSNWSPLTGALQVLYTPLLSP